MRIQQMQSFARSTLAVGLAALLWSGCPGGADTSEDVTPVPGGTRFPRLSAIAVADARALFVASTAATGKQTTGDSAPPRKLFKITDSGAILEVTYQDENGQPVKDVQTPVAVYNSGRDYVIVCFGFDANNVTGCYLVRKSDGTAFSLETAGYPIPQYENFIGSPPVETDAAGNLYYLARDTSQGGATAPVTHLIRIAVQNPRALVRTVSTPLDEEVTGFAVDPAGNAIYVGHTQENPPIQIRRLRKASGGFFNLPAQMQSYWVDLDGRFAYWSINAQHLQRLAIDANNNVSVSDYGTADSSSFNLWTTSSRRIRTSNRILLVNIPDGGVYEVYNPAGEPRRVEGLPLATVKRVASAGDSYYLAGNDPSSAPMLIKVDVNTDAVTPLLPPGQYDISEMAAAPDGELTFNALRMSDGARIIGRISANGTLTVLDAKMDARVVILEPIK